jgi:hypothetical protein
MHPPVELDDAPLFPDITVSFDSDEDNAVKVGYVHGAVKANAQEDNVYLSEKQQHLQTSQLRR